MKKQFWGVILTSPPDGIDPKYPTGEYKEEWLQLEVNFDDSNFWDTILVDAADEGDFISSTSVENVFKEIILNPFSYPNTTIIFEYR